MKIPQFRSFVDMDDYENIRQVFERNYIAEGPCSVEFKDELKKIVGTQHGVLASNGTLAIYLALKALGIGPGDEVLVQNVSFIASANAIEMVGAKPVFVDIPAFNDLTIDLDKIKINPNTKGLMIAHLFGTACSNTEAVVEFCKKNNLYMIEDAAQALYISNGTNQCGNFGDVATFSFYADKTITTAEGGFVCTKHEDVFERMTYLRNQGRKSSGTFVHPEIGYNFRMTDLQCALGLSQMKKIDHIRTQKQLLATNYRKYLGDKVEYLVIREDFDYIPFRVIVFVDDAEKTMAHMNAAGIEPRSMFYPFHKQPCYEHYELKASDFPNSEACFKRGICLPTWVGLSEEQIAYTCEKLLEAL
ncbi:MAG: DegT/DnrJ/EryC1/StrS family aminotransferase [Nitratireductor sp.]